MEFGFASEQESLRQTIRAFAAAKLLPGAARRDETGEFPWQAGRD
jgi:hypothetical protein